MFWGARTEQLEQLAVSTREEGRRAAQLHDVLDSAVRTVTWVGEDAEQLRTRWQGVSAQWRSTLEALAVRGDELDEHAQAQERASAVEGGPAGIAEDGAAEYDDTGFAWIGWHNGLFGFDGGFNPFTGRRNLRDDIPIDDPSEYGIASMNQEGVPNCITIAMLGGLSEQDPQYFMDRIEQIGPEHYEVTLYQDGKPVTVTVDGEVISNGARGSDGLQNWMTLYEAALVQHGVLEEDGSYAGSAGTVVEAVTGVPMPQDLQILQDPVSGTGLGWDIESFGSGRTLDAQAIEALQDQGYTVVLGTENSDADREGVSLVENHAYLVAGANGSTIHLENPWGAGSDYTGGNGDRAPHLTPEQIMANIDSVYAAPPRDQWVEER